MASNSCFDAHRSLQQGGDMAEVWLHVWKKDDGRACFKVC